MNAISRVAAASRAMSTAAGLVNVKVRMDQGAKTLKRFDSTQIDRLLPYLLQAHPEALHGDLRDDAAAGPLAFARGLTYTFKELIEVEFAELRAAEFIPISTEVPAGSLTAMYRMVQKTGRAAVISDQNARDLPIAGFTGEEWPIAVLTTGVAYQFTYMDMLRAALLDLPLEAISADSAKFAIDSLDEDIAAIGYANTAVTGLTNAAGVAGTTQLSTGTWLHQINAIAGATAANPWSAVAVAQGLISDINAMVSSVFTNTKGRFEADTLLLSTPLWSALKGVPRSPAFTNDNLIDFIRSVCHVNVDYWPALDTASSTSKGRVMCYAKNPRVLRWIRPMPFTQLPPQVVGLGWQVPCVSQNAGVNVMQPLAVTYMDGLDDTA